jgi:glycosyltransferase involved in cell wall biosynthesis
VSEPLISILIPCYNAARWLPFTLESALAQSWPNKEVIVVDDGSTDDSLAIARSFVTRGVKVASQPNRGASAARNAALQAARGAWVQFLDADDLIAPDKIAIQMALAQTIGDKFAICATWTRFRSATADADFTPQPLCTDADPAGWLVLKFEQNRMMHPAAWLVSRVLADQAGPWNESLSLDDDGDYFTRVVLASSGVRCCASAISYYRSGMIGSLSGRKSERALQSQFTSLELSARRLLAHENSSRTRHAAAVMLQRFIYEAYPRAAHCRRRAGELVAEFGGCDLQPEGGPTFQRLRGLFGWKLARRLQSLR